MPASVNRRARPSRSGLLRRAACALAAALVGALSLAGAAAADGVGFRPLGGPGGTLVDGYLRFDLAPGGTAKGRFSIVNTGTTSVSVRLFPADGVTAASTGVVYDADAGEGDGAMLTPSIRSVVLAAGEEREVTFDVRVPGSAVSGDHVAAIVFEHRKAGARIDQILRGVAPVLVDVGGDAPRAMQIDGVALEELPGTPLPAVAIKLRHAGLSLCTPLISVSLKGPGQDGRPVARRLLSFLPGDAITYSMPWPTAIKPGTYVATLRTYECGETRTLRETVSYEPGSAGTNVGADEEGADGDSRGDRAPGAGGVQRLPDGSTFDEGPGSGRAGSAAKRDDPRQRPTRGVTQPRQRDDGSSAAGAAGAAGTGSGGDGGRRGGVAGVLDSARDLAAGAADAVAEHAGDVAKRATLPMGVLALIGLLFLLQDVLDRRDEKLAAAPVRRDEDHDFVPSDVVLKRTAPPTDLEVDVLGSIDPLPT